MPRVFVWSRLTGGDPLFTLSQVALNDGIMLVAFAPLVALLLAQLWRRWLLKKGTQAFDAAMLTIGSWSMAAAIS
jgi:ACR3 family arsenite transporter